MNLQFSASAMSLIFVNLFICSFIQVSLTAAIPQDDDTDDSLCTNSFAGTQACNFDNSLCSYKSFPERNALKWVRDDGTNGPIDHDWQANPNRKGSYVYLDVSESSIPASAGALSLISAQIGQGVEAVCIEFHYATNGTDKHNIRVYNQRNPGFNARSTVLLIKELKDVNTRGQWQTVSIPSVCLTHGRYIAFESEKTSEDSTVALDFLKITRSNKICKSTVSPGKLSTSSTAKLTSATSKRIKFTTSTTISFTTARPTAKITTTKLVTTTRRATSFTTTIKPTTTTTKPPITTKPTTTAEPITTTKPTTTAEPVTTTKPTTTAEPITTRKPTTTAEPITTTKPTTTAEPITTTKPTTTAEPITTRKPTTTSKPITTTKTATTTKPITRKRIYSTAMSNITTTKPTSIRSRTTSIKSTIRPSTTTIPNTASQATTAIAKGPTIMGFISMLLKLDFSFDLVE